MNVLVTGGNGQLGCSLKKVSEEYPAFFFIFTDIPELDITNKDCIVDYIRKNNVGFIINCAAYTAVDKAEEEKSLAAKINTEGPKVLAEIARDLKIKLVHISTDYVFDGETCYPLKETTPTNPVGVYGTTKLAGEKAIANVGCDAVIIRTAWLYSEYGNNFVKTMLRLGKERKSMNVVYDQVGTPTYAPDLARAIIKIIENGITGCEVYHFSNEGVISWYDFAKEIFYLSDMKIEVNPIESYLYPTPAKRPAYSVLSKDKIKKAGAEVPYWKDSLKRCIINLQNN